MELEEWIEADFGETAERYRSQIRDLVPLGSRADGAGGTSILWSSFHVASHTRLALAVLDGPPAPEPDWLGALRDEHGVGAGLQEAAQPWAARLVAAEVEAYAEGALDAVAAYLEARRLRAVDLDEVPPCGAALEALGLPRDDFGWLYALWDGRPVSWLVRWPLLGHSTSHVGEMLATRSRLGLNPF